MESTHSGSFSSEQSESRPGKSTAVRQKTNSSRLNESDTGYSNGYHRLVNNEILSLHSTQLPEGGARLRISQIGSSIWTEAEKVMFFKALSRLGKHESSRIAAHIKTKSAFEVREYIESLHNLYKSRSLEMPADKLLDYADLPAAKEISHECCAALDNAADWLSECQDYAEQKAEKRKYGDFWLLTSDVGRILDEELSDPESSVRESKIYPAYEILYLSKWLELSARIFMNPSHSDNLETWQMNTEDDNSPSMRAEAFESFYNLLIQLTRKLVSASIFCTNSRIRSRASQHSSLKIDWVVSRDDVQAACDVVRMPTQNQEYWTGCARRCKLKVYDTLSEHEHPMEYEDVETILSIASCSPNPSVIDKEIFGQPSSGQRNIDLVEEESGTELERACLDLEADHSHSGISSGAAGGSRSYTKIEDLAQRYANIIDTEHTLYNSSDPARGEGVMHTDVMADSLQDPEHDRYAAVTDMKVSMKEEADLWKLLKRDAPFAIDPESLELPDRPRKRRMLHEDFQRWTDTVQYRSMWEACGTPIPEANFEWTGTDRSPPTDRDLVQEAYDDATLYEDETSSYETASDDNSQ